MSTDLYNFENRIDTALEKISKDSGILEVNKGHISEFYQAQKLLGKSQARLSLYISKLGLLARFFNKDFRKATQKDFINFLNEYKKKYSLSQPKVATFKVFIRWLIGKKKYSEVIGDGRDCIIKADKGRDKILPNEILTFEEIIRMVDSSTNARDKCFLSILYDGGFRVGEVARLKIKDIHLDSKGGRIAVTGKTGARESRLLWSIKYIKAWLELHPARSDSEAFVFTKTGTHKNSKEPIKYGEFQRIIKDSAKRAGIKKRTYCHLFRHSRTTDLLNRKVPTPIINMYMGWSDKSDMLANYSHASNKDVDRFILDASAFEKVKEENKPPAIKCFRCGKENSLEASLCQFCGAMLNQYVAMEKEQKELDVVQAMEAMAKEVKGMFLQFLEVVNDEKKDKKIIKQKITNMIKMLKV